ncbi:MAG: hypothetical protein WDO24_15465 [Pseudomonadota bacterium]
MSISEIIGASAALATLNFQATAPSSPEVGPMDMATANLILGDYLKHGNKPGNYSQAQTNAATKFVSDQVNGFIQQAGGDQLAGYVAFLQAQPSLAPQLQNATFYGVSINNTTLTLGQNLAVNQALLAGRDRQNALLQSGAITLDASGQTVGTTADGTAVVNILSLFGSSDPSDLMEGVRQWNVYAAALGRQDTVALSPTAQASVAASSAGGSAADGIILQLAAGLSSCSSTVVDGSIQALAGIVSDNSLGWSLVDQQTAQAALSDVQSSGIALSAADNQTIAQALSQTALDQRLTVIGNKFTYATMWVQRQDVSDQDQLDVFNGLSAADQLLWFSTQIQGQSGNDFSSIQDYTVNLQAQIMVSSIVDNAIASKTIGPNDTYLQIKDPTIAAAAQLLALTPNSSTGFTAQAIKFLVDTQQSAAAAQLSHDAAMQSSLPAFNAAAPTTASAADQALAALQNPATDTPEDVALQTLKNVLKQLKDAQDKAKAEGSPSAPASPTDSPADPTAGGSTTAISFPALDAITSTTGLATATALIAKQTAGSLVNATA